MLPQNSIYREQIHAVYMSLLVSMWHLGS